MIIQRIFQRHLHNISYRIRIKPLRNDATIRLSFKKNDNSTPKTISRNFSAYDAHGRTVGFVINKKYSEELLIESVTKYSFFMASGVELVGSLIIFPHSIMSWHVSSAKDVTEESLILFKLLEPKIDILVFGYGSREDYTNEVRLNFTKCCKNLGLRFEALPTDKAIGTFNFLSSERRLVAAALIPPRTIDVLKFDRSKPLYLDDDEEEDNKLTAIQGNISQEKLIK